MAKITCDSNLDNAISNFLNEWNDDLDYIVVNTSGSTGVPKQIKLSKDDMRTSAQATNAKFGINKDSFLLSPLSVDYIAGKMMIVRALEADCEAKMVKPSLEFSLDGFDRKISLLPIVPSQIDCLTANPEWKALVDTIIIGGGALSQTLRAQMVNIGYNAYATYGMTETCSHVAVQNIAVDTLFRAMPNITFDVDDDSCLMIKSPNYTWKCLTTNDVVELADDKSFKWIGRRDFVINTGGIKVYPEKIEQQLSAIIDKPFYVKGEPDEKWGSIVVLYIESAKEIDSKAMIELCKKHLPKYCTPKKVISVKSFNYTLSGKIKRDSF
jgi:O-succinylbenzoic acid--CoA ligase